MMDALRNCFAVVVLLGVAMPGRQAAPSQQSSHATRAAEQIILSVDPAKSTVHWSVESSLHTVHGTFHVKRGTVSRRSTPPREKPAVEIAGGCYFG